MRNPRSLYAFLGRCSDYKPERDPDYFVATLTGKDTEQLVKVVSAYSADASLGDAEQVLDVSNCWLLWAYGKGIGGY